MKKISGGNKIILGCAIVLSAVIIIFAIANGNKNKIYLEFLKKRHGQNYLFRLIIKWNQLDFTEFSKFNLILLFY